MIVNIDLLMQSLDRFKSGYTEHKAQERANRDIGYKQHIPEQYYPKEWFPMFVYGQAYVLSIDVIDKLLTTIDSYTDYVLDVDDVFITGIIAEKAGVERHYDSRLRYDNNCQINANNLCRMCSLIALVECEDAKEILDFYHEWQQFNCTCILLSGVTPTLLYILLICSFILIVVFVVIFKNNIFLLTIKDRLNSVRSKL